MLELNNIIKESFDKLKSYCEQESYKGWDPYDGLNSHLFQSFPVIKNWRLARLAWIQFFKKSPINLRRLCGVKKEYNAKGVGLFLSGYCRLYKIEPKPEYLEKISFLADKLLEMRSSGYSGSCWGYNFDWQARAFFQPKNTPTVVATTFIASALLEAYQITNNKKYLETVLDCEKFVTNDLQRTYDANGDLAFSYSPEDKTDVYNASLLGVRLLVSIYEYSKNPDLLTTAKLAVSYVVNRQKADGSWSYSSLPFHSWIDNFHTGYNLECLQLYIDKSGDSSFQTAVDKGLTYYLKTFFLADGTPKYYSNSVFPIDIHAPAQLVITLSALHKFKQNQDLIDRVILWTIKNMQNQQGYFYYQINKRFTSKIPYMRWAQAWSFYSLSTYLMEIHRCQNQE